MAAALAGVQAQVAKEQVVWRAGPLVMAPLVQSSLAASQVTAAAPLHCCLVVVAFGGAAAFSVALAFSVGDGPLGAIQPCSFSGSCCSTTAKP